MSVLDLIVKRRSIRQYQPDPVPRSVLEKMAEAARLAPSAANLQPLEFVLINDPETCRKIFPCLRWAAYIAPEGNPRPGREPTAYAVVLINRSVRDSGYERDVGAAVENMLLTAWEEGVGSCWIVSADQERIRGILGVPSDYKIDTVIALGYPAEQPVVEDLVDSVKYWKDGSGRLHVPKRRRSEVMHLGRFGGRFIPPEE
jgi:nitroreductase